MSMDEKKEKVVNGPFLEWTWGIHRSSLIQQGVTAHNLAMLEFTYLHWFTELEHIPINVPLEDILTPLCKVELESFISDFDVNLTPSERQSHMEEILTASLVTVKSFISSFGVEAADFFEQDKPKGGWPADKSGKHGKGKSKNTPKGAQPEEQVPKGGKSQGKKGSSNKPKEPALPAEAKEPAAPENQRSQLSQPNLRGQLLQANQRSQLFQRHHHNQPTRQRVRWNLSLARNRQQPRLLNPSDLS